MTTTERSVEEILEEFEEFLPRPNPSKIISGLEPFEGVTANATTLICWLRTILQTERQKREEMVESLRKDEVKWKKAKYDVKSVEAVIYNRALDDVLQALTQPNNPK